MQGLVCSAPSVSAISIGSDSVGSERELDGVQSYNLVKLCFSVEALA